MSSAGFPPVKLASAPTQGPEAEAGRTTVLLKSSVLLGFARGPVIPFVTQGPVAGLVVN